MPLYVPSPIFRNPDGSVSTNGAALTARQFRPTSMVYDMPILRAKLLDVLSNASDCIIGFYGDARLAGVAAGSGGNSDWNDSARYTPPALIGRLLADSGYPVCRDGWFGVRGQGAASIPAADPQNTMTGTWVTVNASGETLGKGAQRASVSGSTWTYQPPRGTRVTSGSSRCPEARELARPAPPEPPASPWVSRPRRTN